MCRIAQKHLLVACALILGISAAPAEAQVQSTMVLKNGTRHTGNNLGYRIDGREVSMRVSFSEQPRIPVDQVAYVDYGGTPDVNPNLSGSEQAVVLRDGSILKGQIVEIGHQDKEMKPESYIVIIRTSGRGRASTARKSGGSRVLQQSARSHGRIVRILRLITDARGRGRRRGRPTGPGHRRG